MSIVEESLLAVLKAEYGGDDADWREMGSLRRVAKTVRIAVAAEAIADRPPSPDQQASEGGA